MLVFVRPLSLALLVLLASACGGESGTDVPTTGSLQVTVTTTGAQLDEDGYTILVDGVARAVGGGAVQETFPALPAGDRTVELTGVQENCAVSGANPRTVPVPGGGTATVAFQVLCTATTLEVAAVTTGASPDPDGYTVVADTRSRTLASNGSVIYEEIPAGTYTVDLRDIAFNCTVEGENPREVVVAPGQAATTTFEVVCVAPLVTIDGVRGTEEWEGAGEIPLFAGATLLHRTDGTLLYLGVEIEDGTLDATDALEIRFDDAADGALDGGENHLVASLSGLSDGHSDDVSWGFVDTVQHGDAAVAATGTGRNFFELVHPLNSGDPDDFALSPGATVGFCVVYSKDGVGTTATTHPAACQRAGTDLSGYAVLVIG